MHRLSAVSSAEAISWIVSHKCKFCKSVLDWLQILHPETRSELKAAESGLDVTGNDLQRLSVNDTTQEEDALVWPAYICRL